MHVTGLVSGKKYWLSVTAYKDGTPTAPRTAQMDGLESWHSKGMSITAP